MERSARQKADWCIVIADDQGPEWTPLIDADERSAPVQYRRLGGSGTLLQQALRRAARIAGPSRVMATVNEEYRHHWERSLWCVAPERRFLCEQRAASTLTSAAALLTIAAKSPSNVVVILPARCHVKHEWILDAAFDCALALLPRIAEGIVTMGMSEAEPGFDEDYLVASDAGRGPGLSVLGMARRPVAWIVRHLQEQGALVASGILVGYAGAFASHITRHWPGLTLELTRLVEAAASAGAESEIPCDLLRGVPGPVLRSLRWHPPSFAQRALCVRRAGWSGLKSPREVARVNGLVLASSPRLAVRKAAPKIHCVKPGHVPSTSHDAPYRNQTRH